MALQRSAAVTTIAILHLVGGGLGLIGSLCGGVSLLMSAVAPAGGGGGGGPPTAPQIQAHMVANVAGYQAYQVGGLAVGLVLDVLLLSAGMGLLNRQPWARWGSIVYGVLSLAFKAASILYQVLAVNPVMRPFLEGEAARMPAGQREMYEMIMSWSLYAGPCGQGLFLLYPVIVLVVMFLPSTKREFAPGRQGLGRDGEMAGEDGDRWGDSIRDRWND